MRNFILLGIASLTLVACGSYNQDQFKVKPSASAVANQANSDIQQQQRNVTQNAARNAQTVTEAAKQQNP
jgi:hypothetical protein